MSNDLPHSSLSGQDIEAMNIRLKLLGYRSGGAKLLILEVLDLLVDQALTTSRDLWVEKNGTDAFMRPINEGLGVPQHMRDEARYQGLSLTSYARQINAAVHCDEQTPGGRRYYEAVAFSQGGEYCVLCGDRGPLEVDHIDPVSRGGAVECISNLQFLCPPCNAGKGSLASGLVPRVLLPNGSSTIPPAVRVKCLMLASVKVTGRMHGACSICGKTSADERIEVRVSVRGLAANIMNVKACCTRCNL